MLSDAQVKSLKPKESRYSVADGEGLNISVFLMEKRNGFCLIAKMESKIKRCWVNILLWDVKKHAN